MRFRIANYKWFAICSKYRGLLGQHGPCYNTITWSSLLNTRSSFSKTWLSFSNSWPRFSFSVKASKARPSV